MEKNPLFEHGDDQLSRETPALDRLVEVGDSGEVLALVSLVLVEHTARSREEPRVVGYGEADGESIVEDGRGEHHRDRGEDAEEVSEGGFVRDLETEVVFCGLLHADVDVEGVIFEDESWF